MCGDVVCVFYISAHVFVYWMHVRACVLMCEYYAHALMSACMYAVCLCLHIYSCVCAHVHACVSHSISECRTDVLNPVLNAAPMAVNTKC